MDPSADAPRTRAMTDDSEVVSVIRRVRPGAFRGAVGVESTALGTGDGDAAA